MSELERITQQVEETLLKFQKSWVVRHLAKLTQEQQDFFHRVFPKGVNNTREVMSAASLIERTIKKNVKGL